MRGGQDERIGDLKNQFEVLKADIANWNSSALNGTHTLDEIIKNILRYVVPLVNCPMKH